MMIARMSPQATLPNGHSVAEVAGYRAEGGWATETLATELRRLAGTHGNKLAVASMDASISYAELDESADRLAASLIGLGLRPGDPAVFQLGNEVDTVVALFGVLKAGLTPVCAIPNHGAYEVGHIVAATQAKLHLFQADYRNYDLQSLSREISAGSTLTARVAVRGHGKYGALSMRELFCQSDPDESRATVDALHATLDPDSTAVYQLSGGT